MDRPLIFRRTGRELLLLGVGLAFCVRELRYGADWGNLAVYALGTLVFAARLFPARAIGVGIGLAALAQQLPWAVASHQLLNMEPAAYAPFIVVPLLASRDLRQRFDRHSPSWAALPEGHARALRWSGYALGALFGVLWHVWWRGSDLSLVWPALALAALAACVLLLALSRAVVFLAIPLLSAAIMVAIESASGRLLFAGSLEYRLTALGLAAVAAAIATPYALRLVARLKQIPG